MAEKNYKPTQKRLRDAHARGEVVRSRELATLVAFLAIWILLGFGAGYFLQHLGNIVGRAIAVAGVGFEARQEIWLTALQGVFYEAFWILGPLLGMYVVCSVLVLGLQTRGVFSWAPLTPSLERISPGQGLSNLFSLRNLLELGRMLLKTVLLMGVLGCAVALSLDSIIKMIAAPAADLLTLAATLTWRLMGLALIPYSIGAALDYAGQFHQFMKRQKMSVDELRRDFQETEGNPRIKSWRRSLAQEAVATAGLSRVATATVVVVEVSRVSVAIYYAPDNTPLPRVVAKGRGTLAARILNQAQKNGVPVLEDAALARKLSVVAIDHYISEELIDAVAVAIRWARQTDRRQTP